MSGATPSHRPNRLFLLAFAVLLAGAAARAGAPDPAHLLAKAKEAAGGAAWDRVRSMRMEAAIHTAGLEGTVASLADLTSGRFVTRFDLRVARGAEGFDGSDFWSQDSSGDVVAQDSRAQVEASRTEAYRTALGYWYPERWPAEIRYEREEASAGRRFHVLRIHPEGGRPFEMWIDAGTMLIDRTVEGGAVDTTTVLYSDYRDVDGLRQPFRFHSSTGEPGSETDIEVTALELNVEVAEGIFAIPQVRVEDYTIAGNPGSVTLPFELLNNHIYVMASVNEGPPQRFLVDTGGVNLVTRSAAAEMGLDSEGAIPVGGAGEGKATAGITRVERFTLGEITFHDQPFIVIPLDGVVAAEGVDFAGLVGFEVFRRFVVTIDYAGSRLTLTRPEAFRYEGSGVRIPFRYDGHVPVVDGSIDGLPGSFSIDTGSRATLDLHASFVKEHDLAARFGAGLEALTGWGVGGGVRSRVSPARSFTLGGIEVPGVVVFLTAQEKGAFADRYLAGNIGGGVLKRFTVIFSYGDQEMILEPNRDFGNPDAFDRSGMWLNQVAGGFEVEEVVEGGPAEVAGLTAGDRIVEVDGQPPSIVRLPDLRQRFRSAPPGTEVLLTVERDGTRRNLTLVLRDLV